MHAGVHASGPEEGGGVGVSSRRTFLVNCCGVCVPVEPAYWHASQVTGHTIEISVPSGIELSPMACKSSPQPLAPPPPAKRTSRQTVSSSAQTLVSSHALLSAASKMLDWPNVQFPADTQSGGVQHSGIVQPWVWYLQAVSGAGYLTVPAPQPTNALDRPVPVMSAHVFW